MDPLCGICGASWCIHGEGSPTEEEIEIYKLKSQLRQLRAVAEVAIEERNAARKELKALKESSTKRGT